MEILGRISYASQVTTGISQRTGNRWQRQELVVEFFENERQQVANSVVLMTFDDEVIAKGLKENDEVKVNVGFYARGHNGRYFQDTNLISLEVLKVAPSAPAASPAAAEAPQAGQQEASTAGADDLPF